MLVTDINPLTLPSVSLEERSQLPTTPCIYFAIDSQGIIQYIGRSVNPCQRWVRHHRLQQLEQMDSVRLAWLEVSEPILLPAIESALIEYFEPFLNERPIYQLSPQPQSKYPIRWRLRVLMAEKNISNKELAEISGLHRVTISKLKGVDELGQINGETINSVLNGLNRIYQQRGESKLLTPSDLMQYIPDLEMAS